MTGRPLRLEFRYLWEGFDPEDVLRLLGHTEAGSVVFDGRGAPDIVLFSVFAPGYQGPGGAMPFVPPGPYQRVFVTGENVAADMARCEWAYGFDYEDAVGHARYLRHPLYAWRARQSPALVAALVDPRRPGAAAHESKPRFCGFVARNRAARLRRVMLLLLSCYRRVDAPGLVGSNMAPIGPDLEDKVAFLRSRRFTIAFENSRGRGYTTEKICDAFLAGSVPIYWGNPEIARDFNPATFINVHDDERRLRAAIGKVSRALAAPGGKLDPVIAGLMLVCSAWRVVRADRDPARYERFFADPPVVGEGVQYLDPRRVEARWREILAAARGSARPA